MGSSPPGLSEVHCRMTSQAMARRDNPCHANPPGAVCASFVPKASSCARIRSPSTVMRLSSGMLTSFGVLDRTPKTPPRIGVPSDESSSRSLRQKSTSPRLPHINASARAVGVEPGICFHGNCRPDTSSSPTSLLFVVLKLESDTVIDHVKLGISICCASNPVIVSHRHARHVTGPPPRP